MDNAVATAAHHPNQALAPTTLVPAGTGLAARWQTLPAKSQLGLLVGAAALLAVLVFMFAGARDSDYRALFANLSDKDGGAVIDKLTQMNVPYKFAEGGSTIMVPASRVPELRMKLASAGLPSAGAGVAGGAPGYELMDKNSFGQTQNEERVKIQRAREGELTNTIQSLEGVKGVRVHLAMANQNGFFREQQKPSASVAITMHPGRTLDRGQIAGIVRLVSGSVPDLSPKAVAVVDHNFNLLTAASDDESAQGLDSQQLQYRRDVEAGHLKRILALLEPVVGRDNVRASVTADIDFSRVQRTAEAYGPNLGPDGKPAVREQRSEESSQPGSATPSGVPGALSNQPPVAALAPINGASQAMSGAAGGAAGASVRKDTATRYEVDKTTTVTLGAVGNVRRLSAAVVVNHKTSIDAKGKPSTVPLSEKEVEQLTALVQQGIGFNQERGDVVKIVNAPFRVEAAPAGDDTPVWKQPWLLDLLKTAMAPLALAAVALVVVFKLIKPALTQLMAPPPAPEPGAQVSEVVGEDDAADAAAALPPPHQTARLEAARAMAKQNPAAVANIVRGWVNGEAA
jgi:flagellar M-ring protein FliF